MAEPIDNGGPAFPRPSVSHPNGNFDWGSDGMTLRDYFAGKTLEGTMADPNVQCGTDEDRARLAAFSYQMADAMIAARGRAR